jgi:hypothetical protein
MGIGFSLILAAASAVLIWEVNTTSPGFDIHVAGVILLVVGIVGFLGSLAFWSSSGRVRMRTRGSGRRRRKLHRHHRALTNPMTCPAVGPAAQPRILKMMIAAM